MNPLTLDPNQVPGAGDRAVLPLNGGDMEHVCLSNKTLTEMGAELEWLPDDVTLWLTGHNIPLNNIWYACWGWWGGGMGA